MHLHSSELQSEKDMRKQLVTRFIGANQYCTGEDIVNGLEGQLSRATIYKLLKELMIEGLVRNEKQTHNARDNRFSLDESNPFVIVARELDEFESHFFGLLKIMETKYPEMFHYSEKPEIKYPEYSPEMNEDISGKFQYLRSMIAVFHAMLDRELFTAKAYWSQRIQDKEIRSRLFGLVFMRINELEDKFMNKFDERMRKNFVSHQMQFWELEKLHSIYASINEDGDGAAVHELEKVCGKTGPRSLLDMIKLPEGVKV